MQTLADVPEAPAHAGRPGGRWQRVLWPALLTVEGLWAAVLLGLGVSWVAGVAGQAQYDFRLDLGERPVLVLHVARLVAYLAPLAVGALLLAAGALVAWRAAGGRPPGGRGRALLDGLVLAQPFVFPVTALYASALFGDDPRVDARRFLVVALVASGVLALAALAAPSFRRRMRQPAHLALAASIAAVLAVTGLLPEWAASGGAAFGGFSSIGTVATGRFLGYSLSCPAAGPCRLVAVDPVFEGVPVEAVFAIGSGGPTIASELPVAGVLARSDLTAGEQDGIELPEIACPTAVVCYVAGSAGLLQRNPTQVALLRSDDGGRSWQILPPPLALRGSPAAPAPTGPALGCMDADRCVLASGSTVLVTTDAGAHWRRLQTPGTPPLPTVTALVSCGGPATCVVALSDLLETGPTPAVTSGVLRTDDGGATWRAAALPASFGRIESLWCGAGGRCAATGLSSPSRAPTRMTEIVSTDGGLHWRLVSTPPTLDPSPTSPVACPSSTRCLAATPGGILANDRSGGRWRVVLPGGYRSLTCGGDRCVAFGVEPPGTPRVALTTDAGASWRTWPLPLAPVTGAAGRPVIPPGFGLG